MEFDTQSETPDAPMPRHADRMSLGASSSPNAGSASLRLLYLAKSSSVLVWSGLVWSGLVWSGLVWSWSGLVWSSPGLVQSWSGPVLAWSGLV